MKCFYHPEKDAVAQCVICGKSLCNECVFVRSEKNYCKDCIPEMEKTEDSLGISKIVVPVLICGIVAGFLSVFPLITIFTCEICLWVVVGGAAAVYLAKKMYDIEGKIQVKMAALTGGLTGIVASLFMWIIFHLGTFGFASELVLLLSTLLAPFFDPMLLFNVVIRTVLFLIFGGLGGIISNELK
jgi:hypothetical protein